MAPEPSVPRERLPKAGGDEYGGQRVPRRSGLGNQRVVRTAATAASTASGFFIFGNAFVASPLRCLPLPPRPRPRRAWPSRRARRSSRLLPTRSHSCRVRAPVRFARSARSAHSEGSPGCDAAPCSDRAGAQTTTPGNPSSRASPAASAPEPGYRVEGYGPLRFGMSLAEVQAALALDHPGARMVWADVTDALTRNRIATLALSALAPEAGAARRGDHQLHIRRRH